MAEVTKRRRFHSTMATYQPSKEIYKKQLNIMLDILAKQSDQLHSLLTANVNKVTATAREWTEQTEHDMTFNDMVSLITAASTSVLFSTEVIQGIDAGKSIQQQSDQAEGNDPEKIHRVSTVVRGASTKVSSTTLNLRPVTRLSVAAVAPWSTLPTGPTGPDPVRELDRTIPASNRPPMTGHSGQNILQSKQYAVIQDRLTASMLAAVPPFEQKQMLGEKLFPPIQRMYPDLAGKITGMLLEIDNAEILHMLESAEAFKLKVEEAVVVLQAHQAKENAASKR